ncbi:hypothetical protein MUK42_16374 [Musa troglodytarum]|nr:hypothetical protein MUK42_16374 [Musa troglodytarum]
MACHAASTRSASALIFLKRTLTTCSRPTREPSLTRLVSTSSATWRGRSSRGRTQGREADALLVDAA